MKREPFADDWYVQTATPDRPDAARGPLILPDDAMFHEGRDPETRNGPRTGYFPGGKYRYRKTFLAPEGWRGGAVFLEFEGVYQRSQVLVNGHLAGGRASGYALFTVDIGGLLDFGCPNTVEVIADNSGEPNSRWYTGSGIYRPVHLLTGPAVFVAPEGPRAVTTRICGTCAEVAVTIPLRNVSPGTRAAVVEAELVSPAGERFKSAAHSAVIKSDGVAEVHAVIEIRAVQPWSPANPDMYRLRASVRAEGGEMDEAEDEIGIRMISVNARDGLRINGGAVKLRGACVHHDSGVIGAHTLDAAEDRRIRILKESGYNAIRSAHNPLSRAALRACDRRGVLVVDELTDVWWRSKSKHDYSADFESEWERDLASMIAKDFNHPSVIMYSIGNEVAETATPRGIALNRRIARRARELDPSRPVTNAINGFMNMVASLSGCLGT
ncbi:MAG: hypothetical protein LBC97_09850 [Bifidobacteriaceae bacterium]|jgi:beta-galactosidase/beta-glucuronidase|nr:hypothetical protein [Bifidobacteriaceae bacterium]